jgi:hypothetical protein
MKIESPYHARGKGLINTAGPVTVHGDGAYPDGQPQDGIDLGKVHRGGHPQYESPQGRKHREDLREAPPLPTKRRK